MILNIHKRWNGEMICRHIIKRKGKTPLNYLYYATQYPDVHAAAQRIFGSWKNAIEECGIDYKNIRKYKTWSKMKVIEEIKKLHAKGEALSSNHIQKNNKPLYMAAVKRFKSWGKVIKASGIDYSKVRLRRSMNKKEIKKEILELFNNNENLSYPNMRQNHQYLLAAGMKKIGGGSWAKARRKCGIEINYRLPVNKRTT
jgi:5,10-methylene-tetrahydrofolate dehydrogenase/methenyl tetrahydrofolate cyclohydrolase